MYTLLGGCTTLIPVTEFSSIRCSMQKGISGCTSNSNAGWVYQWHFQCSDWLKSGRSPSDWVTSSLLHTPNNTTSNPLLFYPWTFCSKDILSFWILSCLNFSLSNMIPFATYACGIQVHKRLSRMITFHFCLQTGGFQLTPSLVTDNITTNSTAQCYNQSQYNCRVLMN